MEGDRFSANVKPLKKKKKNQSYELLVQPFMNKSD